MVHVTRRWENYSEKSEEERVGRVEEYDGKENGVVKYYVKIMVGRKGRSMKGGKR